MKPRVGVTSPMSGNAAALTPEVGALQHCAALERTGAEPVLLRNNMSPSEVIEGLGLSGLIFSGGGDIAAGSYGGDESLSQRDVDFRRDIFEFALMELALDAELPIFAACRGMQVINIVRNGTLIEDLRHHLGAAYRIPHDQVQDAGLPYDAYAHDVIVSKRTLLHEITSMERFPVNSIHHQAIGELGTGLRVTARAEDGVIEAIESSGSNTGFFLGVQWHPEWLPRDPITHRLYVHFIQACTAHT